MDVSLTKKPPQLSDDELTLHLIASGLVRFIQDMEDGAFPGLPYPAMLQRGLNRLTATCLRRGVAPPVSIPDLFQWCHRPLLGWPLILPPEAVKPNDTLQFDNLPTEICDEWAVEGSDVAAHINEQAFFSSFYTACRAENDAATYVAFRRLLIERPVLTAFELQKERLNLPLLSDQLTTAYQPAPIAHLVNGAYRCCAHCNGLLLQTVQGSLVCENERCRRLVRCPEKEREMSPDEDIFWLKRELRRYISMPGLAELRLEQKLLHKGVQVELWPTFDRYDLRVVFPDDEAWAIDVKDWANPFLLGRSVEPIPREPAWSEAYFVFPNERGQQRSDYARAFNSYCQHTRGLLEREFMQKVSAKLRRLS